MGNENILKTTKSRKKPSVGRKSILYSYITTIRIGIVQINQLENGFHIVAFEGVICFVIISYEKLCISRQSYLNITRLINIDEVLRHSLKGP